MTHECGCHAQSAGGVGVPITPDLTVAHVAHNYPEALQAMKAMGINHCCGAHLSLREAAASAGIELEALLDNLNRPAAAKV